MYDEDGITTIPEHALVVLVNTEAGLNSFLLRCEKFDYSCYEVNCVGIWIWNDEEDKFIFVDTDIAKAFAKMYVDKFGLIEE